MRCPGFVCPGFVCPGFVCPGFVGFSLRSRTLRKSFQRGHWPRRDLVLHWVSRRIRSLMRNVLGCESGS
jgi:hypothetical protein